MGSLTGAVASERVSEALKGLLRMDGNHSQSAKAEEGLTVTPTGGAGTKVGLSDPVVLSGNAIAQRIKAVSYTHLRTRSNFSFTWQCSPDAAGES